MEHVSLENGCERVKFRAVFAGSCDELGRRHKLDVCNLSRMLQLLEDLGVAPVAPDGKVAGNGAVKVSDWPTPVILVSKSGKERGSITTLDDVAFVTSFDEATWTATYHSVSSDVRPSSDTPLLWNALAGDNGWHPCPSESTDVTSSSSDIFLSLGVCRIAFAISAFHAAQHRLY